MIYLPRIFKIYLCIGDNILDREYRDNILDIERDALKKHCNK